MIKFAFTLGLVFLIVSAILFIIAAILVFKTRRFLRSATAVPGKVLKNLSRTDSEGDTVFCPVFVFEGPDGREITVVSKIGTSPPSFRAGQRVKVLYDPVKPEDARISTTLQLWLVPAVAAFIAVIFSLIGLYFLYLSS